MKKRLLSILFTLAVCVGLLSVTALATDDGHTHSYDANGFCTVGGCSADQPAELKDGAYEIGNAGQLYWFARLVNGTVDGSKHINANAVLTANITVNTGVLNENGTLADDTGSFKVWTPIGDMTYKNPGDGDPTNPEDAYAGSFNGQNYTISGLYINDENKNDCALFGRTAEGARISNLTVSGSYFHGYKRADGVCGWNTGTIENCTNTSTVFGDSRYIGGVCGYNASTGKLINCTNTGTVTGKANYTGGVCGDNAGTISNCTNTGTVSGTTYTGGVCGNNNRQGTGASIVNCTNTGAVTGSGNYTGGVCGYNNSTTSSKGTITNCTNSGNVSGTGDYTGGVCGYNADTMTNCTNSGTVSGKSDTGGVCGRNNSGTITNCYFNSNTYLGNAVGSTGSDGTTTDDVEGKTAAQFASGEVAWLLNGSTNEGTPAWRQNLDNGNTPDAYPLPVGKEADATGIVYQVQKFDPCNSETGVEGYSNYNEVRLVHTLEDIEEVPATYESDGVKAHQHCTTCDKDFIGGVEQSTDNLKLPKLVMPIIPVIPTYPPVVSQPAEGGSVTTSPKKPAAGAKVTITAAPDEGYEVDQVIVTDRNGKPVEVTDNGDGTYSFKQPVGKVTIKVTFTDKSNVSFADVPTNAYYYDAVLWAAKNGITDGTSPTTFSPNAPCTRAQMVTFLWRAAGCPEPKGTSSFTDVPTDAYYAKAVAWAVENGITDGVGNDKFAPDDVCTRAQMAAFLCRLAGGKAEGTGTFTDVSADAYYAEAVQWAVENGITDGVGDNRFAPDAVCTRGQMVTFLYRFFVK